MRVEQIKQPQPSFGVRIYKSTKTTYYGRRIRGGTPDGKEYDVYVDGNDKSIFYKLYTVYKDDKWVKSFLRYFSGNKLHKEIKSSPKNP